jgi:hypothetical protein
MRVRRTLASFLAAGALALTSLSLVATTTGCGDGKPPAKTAKVQAADMPDGAEWSGVYYSELYGHLHVIQEGTAITAKWMRPQRDRWGELHGTAVGDLVRFEWTERVVGRVGPGAQRTGRGYFKYSRPQGDNVDDRIDGEIGVGSDETGEAWDGVKQRNITPDLASIGGSDSGDVGGGDWDSANQEPGTPEEPAPPPP